MYVRSIYNAMCMYLLYYVINNLVLAFNRSSIYSRQTWRMNKLSRYCWKLIFLRVTGNAKVAPKMSSVVFVWVCSNFPRFAWKPSALISTNSTHTYQPKRNRERQREKDIKKRKKMRATNFKRESLTADCWERERNTLEWDVPTHVHRNVSLYMA